MILKVSEKLSQLKIYHKIEKNRILTRKTSVEIPKEIGEDIAYLVGVIAGDGTMIKSKRKRGGFHYMIRIYAESKNYIELINIIFEKNFKIPGKIKKDKRKASVYYLHLENASIFWYFKILDSKYNSTNKLPEFCTEEKLFNHYLAGLIDTDGSVGKNRKRIQLKLKNDKIINHLYKRLYSANTTIPKINYTNNVPFYYIRFDNIFPLRWKIASFLK